MESIKPIDYMHPILLQLPSNLLPLIEAPVPVLLGVVGFKDILTDALVVHLHPQQVKIHNASTLDSQALRNLEFALRESFQQPKQLRGIVSKFQASFKAEILNALPREPVYKGSDLDLDSLRQQMQQSRKKADAFIDRLFDTQLFQVYLHEFYKG